MRPHLAESKIEPKAIQKMKNFHAQTVKEVQEAIVKHEWVVVGMGINPLVKKARKHLDAKGIKYHYIGHGNYFSDWKPRLAIKLWTGWPTFPQVFHRGVLVGGASDLAKYLP